MDNKYDNSECFKHPVWLNAEQMNNPHDVLLEFFKDYPLIEVRSELDNLKKVVVYGDETYENGREKGNAIYFLEKVEVLVEAAKLITNSYGKG